MATPKKRRLSIYSEKPASSKSRRTSVKTQKTKDGIYMSTAIVSIKNTKETNEVWTKSSYDNDSDPEEADGNKDNKKGNASKSKTSSAMKPLNQKWLQLRMRFNRNVKSNKHKAEPERIIWDTVTDFEFIGEGWHIYRQWKVQSVTLDGVFNGMESSKNLRLVAGVTSCDTPEGTKLIDIGVAAYYSTPGQVVSLVNPKDVTGKINKRPRKRGVRQSLLTQAS